MLFPQMILNFSELRVYFQRRLRGIVYGMFHAAVNMDKKRKTFGGSHQVPARPALWSFFMLVRAAGPQRPAASRSALSTARAVIASLFPQSHARIRPQPDGDGLAQPPTPEKLVSAPRK